MFLKFYRKPKRIARILVIQVQTSNEKKKMKRKKDGEKKNEKKRHLSVGV
jgi:hypothetical protein